MRNHEILSDTFHFDFIAMNRDNTFMVSFELKQGQNDVLTAGAKIRLLDHRCMEVMDVMYLTQNQNGFILCSWV